MTDTFPSYMPTPSQGVKSDTKITISLVQFGDGYTQRMPRGINYRAEVLDLSWTVLTTQQMKTLYDWLSVRKELAPFWYTSYNGSRKKYICKTVTKIDNTPSPCSVSATFEEVFDLGE